MAGGAVTHSAAIPESCCRYLQVTIPDPTNRIIAQGRALVRAIEALGTVEPSVPFERALASLLSAAYTRRLRAIVAVMPAWVGEYYEVNLSSLAMDLLTLTAEGRTECNSTGRDDKAKENSPSCAR
jgi:hypothetical protein